MDIWTLAPLALAVAACTSAAWALGRLRQLRAVVDGDRAAVHQALKTLRSDVDTVRQSAEALGIRAGAMATQISDARNELATLGRDLRTVTEQVDALVADHGETTVMKRPPELSPPAQAKPDAPAEPPPATRRDGHKAEDEKGAGPASGRTLAGVGPEAERLKKAVLEMAAPPPAPIKPAIDDYPSEEEATCVMDESELPAEPPTAHRPLYLAIPPPPAGS